ncbi:MAG: hypothetical protein PVG03_04665 [Desulfarculaceae bacterium]
MPLVGLPDLGSSAPPTFRGRIHSPALAGIGAKQPPADKFSFAAIA